MTKISAKVVADSKNLQGDRITTMLVTFPRFILAELNTHRMLSKNSASSRAIPFEKMVKSVEENPFIPIAWQKDHKGMQGTEYVTDPEHIKVDNMVWLEARDKAVSHAQWLSNNGVTKQLCNRLLEPFMYHTVLISGTEWENFFSLRCPQYEHTTWVTEDNNGVKQFSKSKKDYISIETGGHYHEHLKEQQFADYNWFVINKGQAEIHMMALAECIWDAYNESTPKQLESGEWHIPFESKINIEDLIIKNNYDNIDLWKEAVNKYKVKISVAMAARTSYTVVGDEKEFGYEKQIELHDRMANQVPFHASPFEHCARAMTDEEYGSYVKGWYEQPKYSMGHLIEQGSIETGSEGWCRNFKGFIQYREILETSKIQENVAGD